MYAPAPNVLLPQKARTPENKTGRQLYVDASRVDKFYDPNGSEQKPYKTIQEAIDASPEYEFSGLSDLQMNVIYIMPGAYSEDLVIDRPIALVGANVLTCHVAGTLISDTSYLHISNLTFLELTINNTTLFTITDCTLAAVTVTNCNGDINNSVIPSLIINNSTLRIFNNCHISEVFEIHDDELEPRPAAKSRIFVQDSTITASVAIEFEILNSGEILLQVSRSIVAPTVTILADMTVENFNGTLLDLDQTLGTYTNYAGYPDEVI